MFRTITRLLCAICLAFASIAQADHLIANGPAVVNHLFATAEEQQKALQSEHFGPVLTKVANNTALDNCEYICFCALSMARTPDIKQFLELTTCSIDDLLAFALQAGNLPAFKHLLQCGANPYHKEHLAETKEATQPANAEKATIEVAPEDITLIDCLTYAAKSRQPQFVLACLEHTAQPTVDIVEIALECFALLPCDTATHTALGDWIAQALRNNPSLLHTHYGHGGTLLSLCAEYGNVELCKLALELGADPNFMTKEDNNIYATPLVAASQINSEQHHACIELLLAYGADPNLHKPNQMLALSNAVRNDDAIAFELLHKQTASAVVKRALFRAYMAYFEHSCEGNILKSLPIMYAQSNFIYGATLDTYLTLHVQSKENTAEWLEKQKSPAWLAQPAAERQNVHAFLWQKFVEEQLQFIAMILEKADSIPLTLLCITGYALRSNPEAFAWKADQTEPDYARILPLLSVFPYCIVQFFSNEDGAFEAESAQAIEKENNLQNNILQACKRAIAAKATNASDLFTYFTPCSEAENQIATNVVAAILGIHIAMVNAWYADFRNAIETAIPNVDTLADAETPEVA